MWTSASSSTPASPASSAAWRAVEWPVCSARSLSASAKLASWTSSWASCAATRVSSQGAVSPLITSFRPARGSPITCSRIDRPGAALDPLAVLEALERRARRNPQARCFLGVEAPRALVLDQRVAVGAHPVLDLERTHLVAVVAHGLARAELDQLDLVADPAEDPPQRLEQLDQPRRPDHPQRALAIVEVVGLQQPRDAQVMVGVQVGDVDLVDLHEPGRALHLALRALAAVEQQPVAADPREQARGRPPRGRHRPPGSEEDEVHVHAGRVVAHPPRRAPLAHRAVALLSHSESESTLGLGIAGLGSKLRCLRP